MSCCAKPAQSKTLASVQDDVKEYYGKTLTTSDDLKTSACTTPTARMKKHVSGAMKLVHDEVIIKYYGCGLVVPECLEGMKILDLGSGSGRDCYCLAKLVGEEGFVTGIDMTDEQLETARKYLDYHQKAFGFEKSNVKFVKGVIENLGEAGITDNSIDIIVSNCVINLCKDKRSVLEEAYRVLKDGGELYFSDVYADRELSEEIRSHKVLWGECISGALHWREIYNLAREIGFETPRTCNAKVIEITKEDLKEVVGDAKFVSVLYRLFKLPKNAKRQSSQVIYNGEVTGYPDKLEFDHRLAFWKDVATTVDGDTAAILSSSRFKDDFTMTKAPCCSSVTKEKEVDPFNLAEKSGKTPGDDYCNGVKCC